MADPIGAASGLLALVAFGLSSSKSLYQTIDSIKNHPRNVRALKEEIEALNCALQSLEQFISKGNVDLSALELPLTHCGKACEEFEALITKCTSHSGGSKTSFRDWAKLKYMGADINGFKEILAGYKSTIAIALGGATLRTSTVTANFVDEYKAMIRDTQLDLEERLREVDEKLQALTSRSSVASDEDIDERNRMQEEKDSTQQCLDICAQASAYIEKLQLPTFEDVSTPAGVYHSSASTHDTPSRLITATALKDCREKLASTVTQLEEKLRAMRTLQLNIFQPSTKASTEEASERTRMQEELDSIKQCLAICSEASGEASQVRTNVFEDVSIADDGQQVLVSTIGDLIRAQRITAGARSAQWFGQMSDTSLQQISRDRYQATSEKSADQQTVPSTQFESRYGKGRNLSPGSMKRQSEGC